MHRSRTLAASVLCLALVGAAPQAPPPPAAPVVRVTLSLVQVDAVVTDKSGRHVTDLTAADFEIFEDGRRQEITLCSYVSIPKLAAAPGPALRADPALPPPPAAATRLRPERVRRTIALVVDDLGLSFRSTIEVRDALEAFVDRQMEPGDLVAIIRTRGGIGALQQFTSDKAQLHAAIERVRFNAAQNRVGVDSFAPIGEDKNLIDSNDGPRGATGKRVGADIEALRQSMLADASLESVRFVVRGLASLPGRKGVVLFSEGLQLYEAGDDNSVAVAARTRGRADTSTIQRSEGGARSSPRTDTRTNDALRRLVDEANRASVVLYAVDTRGLTTRSLGAHDDVNTTLATRDIGYADLQGHLDARRQLQSDTEWGLQALAQETGGFLLRNQNDLTKGIERVLQDQRGYYLIGYARDAASVDGPAKPAFHEIKLSVRRPGLQVRSRAGFYGTIDPDAPDAPPAAATTLAEALASPFASGDIRLELTSLFVREPKGGYLLRSLLHLDTRSLELREVEDGMLGTRLETLAVTFGDNGTVVDQLFRAHELRVTPDQVDRAHQEGLTLRLDVPVKKPGAYQLRVAVRDAHSGRIGSANQLVQVPDLRRKALALSGIVVGSVKPDGTPVEAGLDATAALRRFRRGQALSYSFAVYNARFDRTTGRSRLGARMRLFHDDQLVTVGEQRPIEPSVASDPRQLTGGGAFMLGPEMPLGDYVLQVIVTDALVGKSGGQVATQAVAFEVTGQ